MIENIIRIVVSGLSIINTLSNFWEIFVQDDQKVKQSTTEVIFSSNFIVSAASLAMNVKEFVKGVCNCFTDCYDWCCQR